MAVIRQMPTAAVLTNLYNIIRTTIHDVEAYYTDEQAEALKQDTNNIFLKIERTSK